MGTCFETWWMDLSDLSFDQGCSIFYLRNPLEITPFLQTSIASYNNILDNTY